MGQKNKVQVHLTIHTVSKQKLLGIYIDGVLTWTPQIDPLCSIISLKITHLRQLATQVPTQAERLYYQGYTLPFIDYGSVTWGAISNIERLTKLQKRAARIILNVDFTYPSAFIFKELDWLTVANRLKHNKATLIYTQGLLKRTILHSLSFPHG